MIGLSTVRRWVVYQAAKPQRTAVENIHDNICRLLAEDPILRVNEFNGIFYLDPRTDIFRRLIRYGEYEPTLAKRVVEGLNPNMDAIDIGANVGFYTVLFAKLVSPSRRVLTIEPTPGALKRLYKNLQANNVTDKVIVYEGAISNQTGTTSIDIVEGHEEYSSLGGVAHPKMIGKSTQSIAIACSTLDDLVEKNSLNPGILKIDVEGNEHLVVSGAKRTLDVYRPVIIMELADSLLNKHNSSVREVVEQVETLGYKATGLYERHGEPISNYIFLPL